MKDALLEIGLETLPARFLAGALADLHTLTQARLEANRMQFKEIEVFGSPLRLAVIIRGLPEKTEPLAETFSGPPARLLKDGQGAYTKQAEGFARKYGMAVEDLTTVETPKGPFLAAIKTRPGRSAVSALAEIFPDIIRSLEFPKTMVWEETRLRFARPIRTLTALYGKRAVPFKLAGVKSGNKVRGLAASGAKPVAISEPGRYLHLLRDKCVIVDPVERREKLLNSLRQAAKRSAGEIDEDADAELIEHTVGLTEHPAAVLGHFSAQYLELPRALLLMVLKKQLLFFPVIKSDGELAADFIGVRDGLSESHKEVQRGYEWVLEARLSDARFFIQRDRETKLEEKFPRLQKVGFQKGLGSMSDKTARVVGITQWLGEQVLQHRPLDGGIVIKIAGLAYADLVTGVVGEFPELQGTMGGVYARGEGLDEKIALGLEEFYFPVTAKSPLPTTLEGGLASLAGKIDTIAAMFSAGFKPSGSEDPFALRRLGNGVIRIVLERQLPIRLPELVDTALELAACFPAGREFDRKQAKIEVEEFLWQRLENLLLEKGFRVDEIRAVRDGGLDNLAATFLRIAAVHQLRPEPDFLALAQAFKRADNILKKSAPDPADGAAAEVDKALFRDAAENALFDALCRVEGDVGLNIADGMYADGLRALVGLKPQVDRFFDQVMVMAEDAAVRDNRLNLLSRLVRLFKRVADISHIQN
ncbi:MAG: glycine--tRNA ligase subunit beta [Elusimicrobiota bacterium]